MIELSIILIGSILIVYYSRFSLQKPGSYGFFRFFAWEIILIQFTFDRIGWFTNIFAWYQCLSWILLLISILLLIEGVHLIRKHGKSATTFENTTKLVMIGIYRFIRHPMYASLLFLSWGLFFKSPSTLDFSFSMISWFFLYATARIDENGCIYKFGSDYLDYMKKTKMFIPYIF